MASPPAWSIGTSKRSTDWRSAGGIPGPGSYNPLAKHKPSAPGWRLGTANRSVDRKNEVPGPGSYNSPGKISTSPPRYGFASKSAVQLKSDTPGPGSYEAANARRGFETTPPAFSFRIKSAQPDGRTKVPGPGSYEPTSRIQNQSSPSYKIGTSKRDDLYRSGGAPGPGAYTTRPNSAFNKESGPKYGFGTADRNSLHGMSKTLPGPGQYDFRGTFESNPGKGMSLVPRRPDSAISTAGKTPGPGSYNPNLSTKQNAPAYRIGSASRDKFSRESLAVPGPGNYEPKIIKGNQNVKIGTSVRSPMGTNAKTPGPGTYDYSSKVGEGPKYIMNPRRDQKYNSYVPGPGSYTPSVELVKEKGPGIRMGSSSRDGLYDTKANPGPGQYDVRGNIGGPRWGFGSEMRGKDQKSGIPGPGSYNLPTKIGDVPRYAYGNAPLKIHL